jgi:hypothetical protein
MTKRGTDKWRKKISNGVNKTFDNGRNVWNKNLKGEEYLKHYKNWSKSILNLHPHRIGEYKHSGETLKKLSDSHKGNPSWKKGTAIRIGHPKYRKINGKSIPLAQIKWMEYNKFYRIPKGFAIHHIDGNCENNLKKNLVLMQGIDHRRFHNRLSKMIYDNNKIARSIA